MHWNGGLVEARHNHKHQMFSTQQTCATDFFLNMWYDSIEKCFFLDNLWWQILPQAAKIVHKHISSSGELHGLSFCIANVAIYTGFIVWTFWMNGKWNWKTHIFDRVLQHNIFLNKRIWIIRCFQTNCQLSKFIIRTCPSNQNLPHT